MHQLRERPDDPLGLLVALFHIGATMDRERLAPLALDIDGLAALDVPKLSDGNVTSAVKIDEFDGVHVMSDRSHLVDDFVAHVSPSTRLAAAYTAHLDVDRALDVGTGSGAHALVAARRSGHVVATDYNPRALALTRLNAELNAITTSRRARARSSSRSTASASA